MESEATLDTARELPGFFVRVLKDFHRNQGLLLAGAVAYYTLLAVIPLFALLLIALSHVWGTEELFATVHEQLELVIPGHSAEVMRQIQAVVEERELVGLLGLIVLIFFSVTAFMALEKAMAMIFHRRVSSDRRHPIMSAVIPFAFIFLLGLGILVVTVASAAFQAFDEEELVFLGMALRADALSHTMLYATGVVGLASMLTALYMVMPVGKIALRHAAAGGLLATVLWEAARHLLVWYFETLSLVNVVYGSLATSVIALLSFEVAAVILLLGAQVIAEFETTRQRERRRASMP